MFLFFHMRYMGNKSSKNKSKKKSRHLAVMQTDNHPCGLFNEEDNVYNNNIYEIKKVEYIDNNREEPQKIFTVEIEKEEKNMTDMIPHYNDLKTKHQNHRQKVVETREKICKAISSKMIESTKKLDTVTKIQVELGNIFNEIKDIIIDVGPLILEFIFDLLRQQGHSNFKMLDNILEINLSY